MLRSLFKAVFFTRSVNLMKKDIGGCPRQCQYRSSPTYRYHSDYAVVAVLLGFVASHRYGCDFVVFTVHNVPPNGSFVLPYKKKHTRKTLLKSAQKVPKKARFCRGALCVCPCLNSHVVSDLFSKLFCCLCLCLLLNLRLRFFGFVKLLLFPSRRHFPMPSLFF